MINFWRRYDLRKMYNHNPTLMNYVKSLANAWRNKCTTNRKCWAVKLYKISLRAFSLNVNAVSSILIIMLTFRIQIMLYKNTEKSNRSSSDRRDWKYLLSLKCEPKYFCSFVFLFGSSSCFNINFCFDCTFEFRERGFFLHKLSNESKNKLFAWFYTEHVEKDNNTNQTIWKKICKNYRQARWNIHNQCTCIIVVIKCCMMVTWIHRYKTQLFFIHLCWLILTSSRCFLYIYYIHILYIYIIQLSCGITF